MSIYKDSIIDITSSDAKKLDLPSIDEFKKKIPKLKPMKLGSHQFLINKALGYYPYFSVGLRIRIKHMMANNLVGTGEGGIGKTYMLTDISRVLSKHFSIEDVVFEYSDFMRSVLTSRKGTPIVFDEPSYSMSKKDWYKDITKALVKTIESFRFKGKPLFLPIINKNLLEKDIRSYLLQFQIHITNRGKARTYRLYPAQDRDKVYRYEICKIRYELFDNNLCAKKSCLMGLYGCPKLNPTDPKKRCMIFRAQYERKKLSTQQGRYELALEDSEKPDMKNLSLDEIESKIMIHFDKFYNADKDDVDQELMTMILERKLKIFIGHNKQVSLKKRIKYDFPDRFINRPYPKDDEL